MATDTLSDRVVPYCSISIVLWQMFNASCVSPCPSWPTIMRYLLEVSHWYSLRSMEFWVCSRPIMQSNSDLSGSSSSINRRCLNCIKNSAPTLVRLSNFFRPYKRISETPKVFADRIMFPILLSRSIL